jgi:hypothetical protein
MEAGIYVAAPMFDKRRAFQKGAGIGMDIIHARLRVAWAVAAGDGGLD